MLTQNVSQDSSDILGTICMCTGMLLASSVSVGRSFLVLAPLPQARVGGEPCMVRTIMSYDLNA